MALVDAQPKGRTSSDQFIPGCPFWRDPHVLADCANAQRPTPGARSGAVANSDSLIVLPPSSIQRPPLLFPRGIAVMKLLHRHRILSIVTSSLLLTEFLFFLLVALSVPIIKSIYILGLNAHVQPGQPATSVASKLRFGVWGLCSFR